jgi:hypothetical protein
MVFKTQLFLLMLAITAETSARTTAITAETLARTNGDATNAAQF